MGQYSLRRSLMAFLLLGRSELLWVGWEIGSENLSTVGVLLQFLPERKHVQSDHGSRAVEEGKRTGAERSGWAGPCFEGSGQPRESEPKVHGRSNGRQEA